MDDSLLNGNARLANELFVAEEIARYQSASRFEDLIAWQKARVLTRQVYEISRQSPVRNDYGLADQMKRASVSVMANIAEGFERHGPAEFAHFLSLAKGSCGELRSHLFVAIDVGYIDDETFTTLTSLAEEISRMLYSLRESVNRSRR